MLTDVVTTVVTPRCGAVFIFTSAFMFLVASFFGPLIMQSQDARKHRELLRANRRSASDPPMTGRGASDAPQAPPIARLQVFDGSSPCGSSKFWATVAAAALSLTTTACTFVGQGEGEVSSEHLSVPGCWDGAFDLNPDFFAAVPYRDTMQIRVQRSSDLHEVSDGISVLVNDVPTIRSGFLGKEARVGLAPKLLAEIAPGKPQGPAPEVNLALYLQFSCHNQNVVLYAVSGTITFFELFSGDPNESVGAEKLTDALFDVVIADPRDAVPDTNIPLEIPEEMTSRLTGFFRFHFQRGQPGQPFP